MQESFFDQPQYKQPEVDAEKEMVYSVEECHFLVNEAVSHLGRIKVRGEVNDVRSVRAQMAFFDLKDSDGKDFVMKCAMFGWQFKKFQHLIENGLEVVVIGKLRLYKNGSLSIVAEEIQPYGEGAWQKAFEALKKKLGAKGYFDESRKRAIPQIVQRIGLITSEEGQGLHDFEMNLGNYGFQVLLYGVWVEGDRAEASIVKAFQWFNKNRPDMDVLVLIRGGGGFENLKVFNSEKIAEAIVASRVPVITGIGHEKDESIADYVADKRLSTPTAVAVFLRTQREDLMRTVDMLWENMKEKVEGLIEEQRLSIHSHARELQVSMERVVEANRFSISQMAEKLHRGFGKVFESFGNLRQRLIGLRYDYEKYVYTSIANVEKAASVLSSLNPENVLQRGYSITHNAQGKILKSVDQIQLNDEVAVRLWKGKFSSRVMRKTL
ncbi:MAG TPA: exodeoxyribonuclease VII large subunit [Candidatus Paceibacterota bacterium]